MFNNWVHFDWAAKQDTIASMIDRRMTQDEVMEALQVLLPPFPQDIQTFQYQVRLYGEDGQAENGEFQAGPSSGQATKGSRKRRGGNLRYPEGKKKPLTEADTATVQDKLSLDANQYQLLRKKFVKICKDLNIIQKTRNADGVWDQGIERLINENKYLNDAIHRESDNAYELEDRLKVLDRFCQGIAKLRVAKNKRDEIRPPTPEDILPNSPLQGFQATQQQMAGNGHFQLNIQQQGYQPWGQTLNNGGQGRAYPPPAQPARPEEAQSLVDEEFRRVLDPALFNGEREMGEGEEEDEEMGEEDEEM
ncbi:hypothetical protein MMC30_002660 [Trapelia coarctata]|nr:hypothetical protein [Trapelia coarctata]